MSNYENNISYKDGVNKYKYSSLENVDKYDCDKQCTCRDTNERSSKDMMDYNYYVLKKPIQEFFNNNQDIFQKYPT